MELIYLGTQCFKVAGGTPVMPKKTETVVAENSLILDGVLSPKEGPPVDIPVSVVCSRVG